MRPWLPCAVIPLAVGVASACGFQSSNPSRPAGRIALSVAPLTLPGIDEACYTLKVSNASETVFQETGICSTAYGDGRGAITFVGSCDATSDSSGSLVGTQNKVELILTSLSEVGSAGNLSDPGDFINPCDPGECIQHVTCSENTDTPVTFELAIMRSANQGFFDIAVNFSDIFCSAKADCKTALLFDGGVRSRTAIVAFACTAGSGEQTNMYLDDIAIGGQTFDVGLAVGNRTNAQGTPYAIYRDVEDLAGVGEKAFWNVAISIEDLSGNLSTQATASSEPLDGVGAVFRTSAVAAYPVINFNVSVPAGTSCFAEQRLDAPGSGVTTSYTPLGSPASFDRWVEVSSGEIVPTDFLGPSTLPTLEFQNVPSLAVTGLAWSSFSVRMTDGMGNLDATGAGTVSLTAFQDAGCTTPSAAALTGASALSSSGVAQFSSTSVASSGVVYLKASSPGYVAACSGAVNVTNVSTLDYQNLPAIAYTGLSWPAFSVRLVDGNGNLATAGASTVSLTAYQNSGCTTPASGVLSGGSAVSSAGIAQFSNLSMASPGVIYLKASAAGYATACSSAVNVTNFGTITITSTSTSAGTQIPIKVTIDTAALVTQGKLANTCQNLRFRSADGLTALPYWIEDGCNTTTTAVWVKVPNVAASASTQILYGLDALTASAQSDGNSVFPIFDDFSGTSLDSSKWATSGTAPTVASGSLTVQAGAVYSVGGVSGSGALSHESKVRILTIYPSGLFASFIHGLSSGASVANGWAWYQQSSSYNSYFYINGAGAWNSAAKGIITGTFRIKTRTLSTGVYATVAPYTGTSYTGWTQGRSGSPPLTHRKLFMNAPYTNPRFSVDWTFGREIVNPEPTVTVGALP